MTQGWTIYPSTDKIKFLELIPAGTPVVVKQFSAGGIGGTDSFSLGAWSGEYGYPTEMEFFSDRLWFSNLQTIWGSQIGDYTNFGRSTPIIDSDAVSFTINARQVNAVIDLIPLDKMVILTKGAEWLMRGGQDDVITPSTIDLKPQSFRGSSEVQSKTIGDTAIFVQDQGHRIFDIGYRFESDGYKPREISTFADHLVEGHTMLRMEWMPAPWQVVWLVRDDGIALGCTYMPEQEIIGWHRHDTDGVIEEIVCLPGQKQTQHYAVIKRIINGVERRYLEKMAEAFVSDSRDWFYVDSGLTYDGRNTGVTELTITGGMLWDETETLLLTATSGIFVGVSDQGDGFTLTIGGETTRVIITEYLSAATVHVQCIGTVPESIRGVSTSDYVFLRDKIGGLDHLEGKTVSILTDGSVHQQRVVTGGIVELDYAAGVVTVGLPYRAHLETLDFNAPGGAPMRDTKKCVTSVGLLVKNTLGLKAGASLDYLDELAQREFENYGEPTRPLTGYGRVDVSSNWDEDNGRIHIISDDPVPAEILSITPKFIASET